MSVPPFGIQSKSTAYRSTVNVVFVLFVRRVKDLLVGHIQRDVRIIVTARKVRNKLV